VKGIFLSPAFYICIFAVSISAGAISEEPDSQRLSRRALADELFCILGDTGAYSSQVNAMAKSMRESGCTQVRILGDLVYPAGLSSRDDPLFVERFERPFKPLLDAGIPFYIVQGNHDYVQQAPEAWLEIAKARDDIFYPSPYYVEQWEDLCIFSLETTYWEKLYYPRERIEQSVWFNDVKEEYKQRCKFSIVFAHHPLRSPGNHGDALWQLSMMLKWLVVGHVDLFIAGHEHILADAGVEDGTHMLISGSAAKLGRLENSASSDHYSAAKPGFITLSIDNTADPLSVSITFYAYDQASGITKTWHENIIGQGIRN
jgi:predicted phosphodiesterase